MLHVVMSGAETNSYITLVLLSAIIISLLVCCMDSIDEDD